MSRGSDAISTHLLENPAHSVMNRHWETSSWNSGGLVPSWCIEPSVCWHLKPAGASCVYDLFNFTGDGGRDQKLQDGTFALSKGIPCLASDPTSTELRGTWAAQDGEGEGKRRGREEGRRRRG